MTKEEAIDYLDNYRKLYADLAPEKFLEALDTLLSESQLSSNLNEAAEEYAWMKEEPLSDGERLSFCFNPRIDAFKAGSEWNDRQYRKIEGKLVDWYETKGVDYCCGIRTEDSFEVPEGFYIKKKI